MAFVNRQIPAEPGSPPLEQLARAVGKTGVDPLAVHLREIRTWLASDLRTLESALQDVGRGREDLARRAATHLLDLPGKRVRPLCVALAARTGGRLLDDTVRDLAVACELVHTATLLHDDVIDVGTERRGAPTSRVVYGNAASVLAGDHLLIEALRRVSATGIPGLLDDLLDVIAEMVRAEAIQLEQRGRFEVDPDIYMAVARGKTAVLFGWGFAAGARAAGLSEPTVEALRGVGLSMGVAFQLIDDVLDILGGAGKDALVDLEEGKLTWPLIEAVQADPTLFEPLRAAAIDGGIAPELMARIHATGCVDATRALATRFSAEATTALARVDDGPARRAIEGVIEATLGRAA